MIVVSDTSPLNYLVLIGQVEVLPALFDRVIAPPAVISELLHVGAPVLVRTWAASPPAWLDIVTPSKIDATLRLGPGETEAICVARELQADLVLIDERKATAVAEKLGLTVIATLLVLELAADSKLLDLGQSIAALRQTTFRATESLYSNILQKHAQGKKP